MDGTAAQTPVVLIHGIRVTSAMWRHQQDALAATGRTAIAIDLPGHGVRSDQPFTIDGAMAVVREAVEGLGGKAVVVGLSLGGYIAITYAARFPDTVVGVVAADCSAEPVGIAALSFEIVASAIGRLPDHGERLNHLMLDRFLPDEGARDVAAGGFSPLVVADVVSELRATDPCADLASLRVPVWIVNGEWDQFRLQERKFVRSCADGRLVIIHGAGHLSSLMAPVEFTRVLLEALVDVDARRLVEAGPGVGDLPGPIDDARAPAVRVRLDLSYDGTGFAGWAIQPGLRTVQGVLEDTLATVLRLPEPARLTVAGRTDAGVHARGQVAHLEVPLDAWLAVVGRSDVGPGRALVSRLGGALPRDVVVHRAAVAPDGFDARFAALHRRYSYRISDRVETRDPLRRHHVVWHRRELDEAAMADAAERLLGERDFAAFCRAREGASTIRTLQVFSWARPSEGPDTGLVVAVVQADAFCHSMVRALVGACIAVGEGRRRPDWPAAVLAGGLRDPGSTVAPAHGLSLDEVAYPAAEALAARAKQTRAKRELTRRP